MSVSGIGSQDSYAYYLTSSNAASNTLPNATSVTSEKTSPFANLNLTASQQNSINQTLEDLQSGAISPTQAQSQINSVLTPAQQSQLQQNLQQLQTRRHHHHHQDSSASGDSSSTDEFGIPNSNSGSNTSSIGDVAATYWAQSQTNSDT